MGNLGLYFVFLIPPLIIGFVIQRRLKRTVAAQMQVPVTNGMTARRSPADPRPQRAPGVPVNQAQGGPLSDHYDPRHRSVNLSPARVRRHAVASAAIAAHEVGHAIQHETAYSASGCGRDVAGRRVRLERVVVPAHDRRLRPALGLATLAIILFAVVVLFQLVTLPVEFDASRRAKEQIQRARARHLGRAAGREQGAQRGRDDVRRSGARRAVAARVLRAHLPRQPQLAASCGSFALVLRAAPSSSRSASSSRCSSTGRRARSRPSKATPTRRASSRSHDAAQAERRARRRRASSRSRPSATS